MGFPCLLSKPQCYPVFVPAQSEASSSPLTLVFMQQIPHEEKQRREWGSAGAIRAPSALRPTRSTPFLPLRVIVLLSSPSDASLSPLSQRGWRPPLGQESSALGSWGRERKHDRKQQKVSRSLLNAKGIKHQMAEAL